MGHIAITCLISLLFLVLVHRLNQIVTDKEDLNLSQYSWLVNLILSDKNDQLVSPPTIFVSNLLPREICLPIDHHTVWLQRLVNTSWSLQYQGCWWFFCRNLWVFGLRQPLLKHFWFTYGCPVHKTFYFLHISLPFSVSLSFFTRPRQISSLIYPLTDWLPPHSHFLLQLASGHSNSV